MTSKQLNKFGEEIRKVLFREELDRSGYSSDSDCEEFVSEIEDNILEDICLPENDSKVTTEEEDSKEHSTDKLTGRNGTVWFAETCHTKHFQPSSMNMPVFGLPGPQGAATNVKDESELFSLLVTEEMLQKIVMYTNEEIELSKKQLRIELKTLHTDIDEIKALIGLLYIAGILKCTKLKVADLFSKVTGPSIFRSTMCQNRFELLTRHLRFASKSEQNKHATDKFLAFREFWDSFMKQCASLYTPTENVTIDDTILKFNGTCPFKINLPQKRDQCGLKIVSMYDSRTCYLCSGLPFINNRSEDPSMSVQTKIVMKLTEQIYGTNRNVFLSESFTSMELVDRLKEKNVTVVGCLKSENVHIPKAIANINHREEMSTEFLYQKDKMLVSYMPSKQENILLVSSVHSTGEMDSNTRKPEIVLFYEYNKEVLNAFDRLCQNIGTSRRTQRWPMRLFYTILDMAGINAFVLYKLNGGNIDRSSFLKQLSLSLIKVHIASRLAKGHLPPDIRLNIRDLLSLPPTNASIWSSSATAPKPSRCSFCDRKKDRKAHAICKICEFSVCGEHKVIICPDCYENTVNLFE